MKDPIPSTTLFVMLLSAALSMETVGYAESPYHCADHFKLAGPCFTIRGRLSLYQANPGARIWPVGSNRLLGVATVSDEPENPKLPPPLNKELDDEKAYFGNFTVCPLGPDVPGEMRYVCVESITHVVERKF